MNRTWVVGMVYLCVAPEQAYSPTVTKTGAGNKWPFGGKALLVVRFRFFRKTCLPPKGPVAPTRRALARVRLAATHPLVQRYRAKCDCSPIGYLGPLRLTRRCYEHDKDPGHGSTVLRGSCGTDELQQAAGVSTLSLACSITPSAPPSLGSHQEKGRGQ